MATAKTTYGTCGVKVWVFKGEILAHDPMAQDRRAAEQAPHEGKGRQCCNQNAPSTARRTRAASMAMPRVASTLNFGTYGLKALEPERITARQIEAAAAPSPAP